MGRHCRKLARKEHFEQLAHVTTITVICDLFHITRNSVINAIVTDQIAASKEGTTWLVNFNSALEYYRPGNLVEISKKKTS